MSDEHPWVDAPPDLTAQEAIERFIESVVASEPWKGLVDFSNAELDVHVAAAVGQPSPRQVQIAQAELLDALGEHFEITPAQLKAIGRLMEWLRQWGVEIGQAKLYTESGSPWITVEAGGNTYGVWNATGEVYVADEIGAMSTDPIEFGKRPPHPPRAPLTPSADECDHIYEIGSDRCIKGCGHRHELSPFEVDAPTPTGVAEAPEPCGASGAFLGFGACLLPRGHDGQHSDHLSRLWKGGERQYSTPSA